MPRHADGPKHGTTVHRMPFRTRSGKPYNAETRRKRAEDGKYAKLAKHKTGDLTNEELSRRAAALAAAKNSN
jgi:hypothetical protein